MNDFTSGIERSMNAMHQMTVAKAQRERAAAEAQIAMPHLLSGAATFAALKEAVDDLAAAAPKDHDVLIQAFNIGVVEVRFLQPHTFLFRGFDQEGNHTFVVVHFSQMVARVVYLPKRGPERVITGFAVEKEG
jgi:hypothetical protein